ncbi:hypothetical protein ACLEPN_09415 [Myxococcus sp. 1LA]
MKRLRPIHRPLVVAGALFTLACGGPPEPLAPAEDTPLQHHEQALTPLTATITGCSASGMAGRANFTCMGSYSGGITGGPFPYIIHIEWMGISNATIDTMYGDDTTQTSLAFGRCTPGTVAHVRFEVSQFMGDTVSDDITFNCPYVP